MNNIAMQACKAPFEISHRALDTIASRLNVGRWSNCRCTGTRKRRRGTGYGGLSSCSSSSPQGPPFVFSHFILAGRMTLSQQPLVSVGSMFARVALSLPS